MQSAPLAFAKDMTMSVKLSQQCNPIAMSKSVDGGDDGSSRLCSSGDDDGFSEVNVDGMNHVFVSIVGDMGGIQKSSKLEGEKENCSA